MGNELIGVIGAMRVEMEALIARLAHTETRNVSGVTFTKGTLDGQTLVCAVCGIGKVFAGLCAEAMILQYHPTAIINVGVGGTLCDKLKIADVAVAEDLVQHDMDTSALGDEVGLLSGINIVKIPCDNGLKERLVRAVQMLQIPCLVGTIASGDQFINSKEKKAWITGQFHAIACEMEGAAIAQVCYVNQVPFAVLRTISDCADDSSSMDYPAFVQVAAAQSQKILDAFLTQES